VKVPAARGSAAVACGALAVAALAYAALPAVRHGVDDAVRALAASDPHAAVEAVRAWALGFGALAPLASAALMVLQAVVAPLPAFVVTFANGLLFGWAWGALLSWSSAMAGAALCFWIARALGRPAVERLVGGAAALDAVDRFFARNGPRAILVARLLPFVPFDLVSYGAGLTPTRLAPFLVATGLGQLPATLVYSWLGESFTGSVRVLFWAFSLLAALLVAGWIAGPRLGAALRPRGGAGGGQPT
jgi:uncharacterized membrane protein YdjX (TVP38/TMEM64 family)